MMGSEAVKKKNNNNNNRGGEGVRRVHHHPETITTSATTTEFVLQWGNRKRLRCMKIHVKGDRDSNPDHKTMVRVDRRVVSASRDYSDHATINNSHLNLRRPAPPPPPPPPPPPHRILRNSETCSKVMMKGHSNGIKSGERREEMAQDNNNNNVGGASASSETAHDSKKGGSSSSGGGRSEEETQIWLPKFVMALSNKEKEEDFMAIMGCKLPLKPKKRTKFVQRILNVVSPGAWLCDLTLERYMVREKKISKKRARGLKAFKAVGNVDSDSD